MNETENPWKTIGVRTVYQNPWIRVEEHEVVTPAGKPGIYGKVCARGRAVGILALDEYDHVWLVGQYRYPVERFSWEIPEGSSEPGEEPLDAAKRELAEETGLTAREWKPIQHLYTTNCVSDEEAFVFLATGLTEGPTCHDETERLVIRRMPFPQVLDMVLDGQITDAITVAAILKAAQLGMAEGRTKILFQDSTCVAVCKPAGLLVHRTPMCRDRDFLLQRVRNQIREKVYPIHRLDKPTSGIVLFGIGSEAAAKFSALFQEHEVRKTYLAVVRGFTEPEGVIDLPVKTGRNGRSLQEAVTRYRTIESVELPIPVGPYETARYSLVEIEPETGRMHQIRRHFNAISHPVIGDTQHGDNRHNRMFIERFHCRRLLLFARRIEFVHPYTKCPTVIEAELDDDFSNLLAAVGFKALLQVSGKGKE
jgi:tRNA pseudouridine65 synthase